MTLFSYRNGTLIASVCLALGLVGCDSGDGTADVDGEDGGGEGTNGNGGNGGQNNGSSADGGSGKGGGEDNGESSGSSGGNSSGDSGDDNSGGSSDSGTGKDDEPGACATECDDGVDCTTDECVDGSCVHRVDSSVCAEGESCDVAGDGCTAGTACGDEDDCEFPVCSQNRSCDASQAACVYDVLDMDDDGFAPSVCGGGDCDDADPSSHPAAVEACNGRDDDCDGEADDDAECPNNLTCQGAGTEDADCECPDDATECRTLEGPVCVNTANDPAHCGACNNNCGEAGVCDSGVCTCPASGTECRVPGGGAGAAGGALCVDQDSDPFHCGACNSACSVSLGNSVYGVGLCAAGACGECGDEGEACCTLTTLGTGCGSWLTCDGTAGAADSECVPCGQEVGQPCCTWAGEQICAGEFGPSPVDGGPVCGSADTCVAP